MQEFGSNNLTENISVNYSFTILGCGSSQGVPTPTGQWYDCDPSNPMNRRSRCAGFLELEFGDERLNILLDCSPDFRYQMGSLIASRSGKVPRIDAALLTHPHMDHITGVGDLSPYKALQKAMIPVYGDANTLGEVQQSFQYLFGNNARGKYPQVLDPYVVNERIHSFDPNGIPITAIKMDHWICDAFGYRIGGVPDENGTLHGGVGYCMDFKTLSDNALESLQNLDVWVVDCSTLYPNVVDVVCAEFYKTLEERDSSSTEPVVLKNIRYKEEADKIREKLFQDGRNYPFYITIASEQDEQQPEIVDSANAKVIDCGSLYRKSAEIIHAGLPEIIEYAKVIKPKRFILSGMNGTMDYAKVQSVLAELNRQHPFEIIAAYDGMEISGTFEIPICRVDKRPSNIPACTV